VTRPSFETLTLVRPNPVGLDLPTPPEGPPILVELKIVGRDVGR
jgi:hypothetical protein